MKKIILSLFSTILILWGNASTIYVDLDASGSNNGTSWTNAYTNLQNALASALNGDEVWVAEGTYYPATYSSWHLNHIDSTFSIPNGVSVYGGFNGNESLLNQRNLRNHTTILNGDINRNDNPRYVRSLLTGGVTNPLNLYNVYHVVTFNGSDGIIDGFEIINGGSLYKEIATTSTSDGSSSNSNGGSTGSASPGNAGTGFPITSNINVEGPKNNGGGIYIINNSSPTIRNVMFRRNLAQKNGGAAYIGKNCTANFQNSIFTENYVSKIGILFSDTNATVNIQHCTFYNNRGGKNLIASLYSNLVEINNSILWDAGSNITSIGTSILGSNNISFHDINTLDVSNDDPLLFKPDYLNFEPTPCSPAVNSAGTFYSLTTDYYGETRTGIADIGAVENSTATIPINTGSIVFLDKDANGSGDGTNWSNAYSNIYDAVLSAYCNNIQDIWVADGIYSPSDSSLFHSINLTKNINIYGGFSGIETMLSQRDIDNNQTIFSGDLLQNDGVFGGVSSFFEERENAFTIFINAPLSNDSVLINGFTIEKTAEQNIGGFEYGLINLARKNNGGKIKYQNCKLKSLVGSSGLAVYNSISSSAINLNNLSGLSAKLDFNNCESIGFGFRTTIFQNNSFDVSIKNSIFKNSRISNISKYSGIINLDIDSTLIEKVGISTETQEAGIINALIRNSTITETDKFGSGSFATVGGALDVRDYGGINNITIQKSTLIDNEANYGGAIGVFSRNQFYSSTQLSGTVNLNIFDSKFTQNKALFGACIFIQDDLNSNININSNDILAYKNESLSTGGFIAYNSNGGDILSNFNNLTVTYNSAKDSAAFISQNDFNIGVGSVNTNINNSIIYNNFAPAIVDNGNVVINNPNNPKRGIYNAPSLNLNFNYCSIDTSACYDNTACGLGMQYNQNPNFISFLGDIFKLSPGSPAINSGSNTYTIGNAYDIEDSIRIKNGLVDLGCYEGAFICATDSILYVDSSAFGNNDGSSWTNAFNNLPDAFTKARDCNIIKEIWIAQGTYFASKDSTRTDELIIQRNNLKILGGFPSTGNATFIDRNIKLFKTIISADLFENNTVNLNSVFRNDDTEYLIRLQNGDSTNVISGITFKFSPGLVIEHNNFFDLSLNSNPLIEDCEFTLSRNGCVYVQSSQLKMPAPVINRCKFYLNQKSFGGTGIYLQVFANAFGLGNSQVANIDTTIIANCLFHDLYSTTINQGFGGAIYARSEGQEALPIKIKNSTFTKVFGREHPVLFAQNCNIKIENSISYRNATFASFLNTNNQFYANNSSIEFYNSSIEGINCLDKNGTSNGGALQCFGNMFYDTDPLFTDEVNDDFTLLATSSLIDKGDNFLIYDSLDLKLEKRIISDTVDLGCYEQSSCFPSANFTYQQNDSLKRNYSFTSTALRADSVYYDFGDWNTSTLQNPIHTYATSDTFTVCQIAFGDCGNDTICKNIIVECVSPMGTFSYIQPDNTVPEIHFTSLGQFADSIYFNMVSFGLVYEENPVFTFPSAGSYLICYITESECLTRVFCRTITVNCQLPTAGFSFIQDQNQANLLEFTSTAVNADSVKYNFGDGDSSLLDNPSHIFANSGEYVVCQFAYGNCGIDTICDTIEICSLNSIVYVNDIATGNNDGTSWMDAFTKLDDAVLLANNCNTIKEIRVSEGTYKPGDGLNRDSSFYFFNKDSIKIYGGFANTGNPTFADRNVELYETILDGNIGFLSDSLDNSYHLIKLNNIKHSIIDGFTIQNCYADFAVFNAGAILTEQNSGIKSVHIKHCKVQNNSSEFSAGAGININASQVSIIKSKIQNNYSSEGAGMICNLINLTDTLIIDNCDFIGNEAITEGLFGQGGGALLLTSGKLFLNQTKFIDNKALDLFGAPSPGGAISIPFGDSLYAENSLFIDNTAGDGGAINISNIGAEFRHCTFYGNKSIQGGFVMSSSDKDVLLRNSIIWNNKSLPFGFGSMFSTISNHINFDGSIIDIPNCSPIDFSAQCIGAVQFNIYPLFADTASRDLKINACSPAIDFSNPFYSSNHDIDGNLRPINNAPDAGAFEWNGTDGINYEIFNDSSIISNTTQIAETSFTDSNGWTHYYDCDSSNILLSINLNAQNIGILGAGLDIGITINSDFSSNTGQNISSANFHSETHFYAMNRTWFVNSFQQPTKPLKVRFYFNENIDLGDIAQVYNNAIGSNDINNISDLVFYKLRNTSNPYDLSTIPNDANIYYWSNTSSLTTWTDGIFNGLTYAEFEVASFSTGSGAASSGLNPLPVALIRFEAQAIENTYIKLNWTTATEINNEGFFVERSIDGIQFETINFVKGNGNTSDLKSYSYDDFDVVNKKDYYYRLKQIDFDGKYEYSEIKTARLNDNNINTIKVYPNPSRGFVQILNAENYNFTLFNINGKEIESGFILEKIKTIDLSNFVTGNYYIRFTNSENNYTIPITVTN